LTVLLTLPCSASAGEGQKIFLRSGYAFVDATINGRGPFRMLIDTGAYSCMLTPDAARRAGLSLDHRTILTTLTGEKTVPGALHNLVQAGTNSESDVDILVTELAQLRQLDGKVDGVLGQSFLSRSAYLLDYHMKRLWLGDEAIAQAGRLPIAVASARSHGRTMLPVVLAPGGAPWRLTLDSGASHVVIACGDRCPGARGVQEGVLLTSYVGERTVPVGTLRYVEIGGVRMPPAEAVLVDSPALDGGDDGVLPTNWFSAVYANGDVVRLGRAR